MNEQINKWFLRQTRKGVPELRGPALVCLSVIDKKISALPLVLLMDQNPKCPGYNSGKKQGDNSNISSTCIPSTNIAGANLSPGV